jgi:hypothetical protein
MFHSMMLLAISKMSCCCFLMIPRNPGKEWKCCPYSDADELLTTLVLKTVSMAGVKKMMSLLVVRPNARHDEWFHSVSLPLGEASDLQKQLLQSA